MTTVFMPMTSVCKLVAQTVHKPSTLLSIFIPVRPVAMPCVVRFVGRCMLGYFKGFAAMTYRCLQPRFNMNA